MSNEEAIEWLVGIKERTIADLPKEALDIAIKTLQTGEVCMSGEDYNMYLEGYKDAKKEFERQKGECENCDFRKFSETFVDGVVDVMNKNGITSVEQLSEILKGGAK